MQSHTRTLSLLAALLFSLPVHAQTYDVIHNFSGGSDSGYPEYGVTLDALGNVWGTTASTVFEISSRGFSTVYTFISYPFPEEVLVDSAGTVWGSNLNRGDRRCDPAGCGTLFNLRPSPSISPNATGLWNETTLHTFTGQAEGRFPNPGMVMDSAGNLFGTTSKGGGACDCGTVFELSRSGQTWILTTLYSFTGGVDGSGPLTGVVAIGGKLYGTTWTGGSSGWGVVYELARNGAGWSERPIYTFHGNDDGGEPYGGLTADPDGNLYGSTLSRGPGGGGTIFKLTNTAGAWGYQLVYGLTGSGGPTGSLALDSQQNIYGAAEADGAYNAGSAFKLTPNGQGWTYHNLHDFCAQGCGGGYIPLGTVSVDQAGNLFGITGDGGTGCAPQGCGVVWEITP
jgi:uncharacterized repeat protein (TIGR03803 family)